MRAALQTNFVLSKVSVVETLIGQDTVGAKLKVEQKLADAVGQLQKNPRWRLRPPSESASASASASRIHFETHFSF